MQEIVFTQFSIQKSKFKEQIYLDPPSSQFTAKFFRYHLELRLRQVMLYKILN